MPEFLSTPEGESIAYHHRDGQSPGVLFCPGFNSDMQGNKALALEAWCGEHNRQFTRFDYYGHGESSGRVEEGTVGRWRDDTLAVLEQVTRGPQLIVGSSMGGWMMLLAALAVPERVAGLIGLAAAPDFTRTLAERLIDMGEGARLQRIGYVDLPSDYDDGRPYRISRRLLEEGDRHLLLDSDIPISLPVRLIHGQCDTDIPWQHALRIAARLASDDVEVHLIKTGDHRLSSAQDLRRLLATVADLCPD
jgi:pimeloyl-ACP methyl ester carboxylesterase